MASLIELQARPLQDLLGLRLPPSELQRWQRSIESASARIRRDLGLRADPLATSLRGQTLELRASGISGMLGVRNLTIQIAPKFASGDPTVSMWPGSVLNMVAVARRRDLTYSRVHTLAGGAAHFLDHVALAYADALERGLRRGAIQTYQPQETASLHLRGTLLVHRQLETILTNPRILHCRTSELDADNVFNQVLHWAGAALLRHTVDASVRRALRITLSKLPPVSDVPSRLLHIPRVLPRQHAHYKEAFDIAMTLARGQGYRHEAGPQPGYGYILNMERIFEGFVDNSLRSAVSSRGGDGWVCLAQQSKTFAVAASASCRNYGTRPDNEVKINGELALLIDAKYKTVSPVGRSRVERPENTDLYQLFASLTAHGCRRGLMVHPIAPGQAHESDPALRVWRVAHGRAMSFVIATMGLDVSDLTTRSRLRRAQQDLLVGVDAVLEWPLEA